MQINKEGISTLYVWLKPLLLSANFLCSLWEWLQTAMPLIWVISTKIQNQRTMNLVTHACPFQVECTGFQCFKHRWHAPTFFFVNDT